MARSVVQLQAWAELLELCEDGCQVFRTTRQMRSAVIEVERELGRLHKIEMAAIDAMRADDRESALAALVLLVEEASR